MGKSKNPLIQSKGAAMGILKALNSLMSGCVKSATSVDMPAEGVKVEHESPLKRRFRTTTPVCVYCLKEFLPHKGGVRDISKNRQALISRHVQQCPENPLVMKLEAAAEALRQIECLLHGLPAWQMQKAHKLAQAGWRAATNRSQDV